MLEKLDRIDRRTERRRGPSKGFVLSAIVSTWVILFVHDAVFAVTWSDTPASHGLFRLLLPLIGLVPMILRLLNAQAFTDDQEAYRAFVRMTVVNLVLGGVLMLFQFIPFGYTRMGVPDDYWSFVVGRIMALAMLIAVPIIGDELVSLYHYRVRSRSSRMARVYIYSLIGLLVVGQFFPLDAGRVSLTPSVPMEAASVAVGVVGFILSIRFGWLINLRKRQKLALLGLSFVGFIASVAFTGVVQDTMVGTTLLAVAPTLPTFVGAIAVSLLFTHMVIFVTALLALPTADAIDRRNDEVTSLANFTRLLTESLEEEELVQTVIAITCDTGAQAAWLELWDGERRELHFGAVPRCPEHVAGRMMNATTHHGVEIAKIVKETRRAQVVERLGDAVWEVSSVRKELRSVVAVPLLLGEKYLGTLYAAKERVDGFDREQIVLLNALADQIAVALDHSRLIRTSLERTRLEQEMMIARDLQQRLLPKVMPESPCFEIYAESRPASIVGGDYYDVVTLSDGTLAVLVADVAGKGASAALYMGMVKGIVQAVSGRCDSPKELLARANVALHGAIDQRWFATMTCAQIMEDRRTLRICRAGHCPTLVVRNGGASFSRPKGLGLAIAGPEIFDRNLSIEEIAFQPGDYAIFFSDGLPEAGPGDGREFGYEALLDVAAEAAAHHPGARDMRDAIVNAIEKFSGGVPPSDDSTLVVLRWR